MMPIVPGEPAHGNAEVVALFKKWLKQAELGQINFAALVVTEETGHCSQDYIGVPEMAFTANWGLDMLKAEIMKTGLISLPISNATASADRWSWNLAKGPMCFDFFAWMTLAEMTRRREGAPAPLRVGFHYGSDILRALRNRERKAFFENVMRPSLALFGAVEDEEAAIDGRKMEYYTLNRIVNGALDGQEVPKLKPSAEAMKAIAEQVGNRPPVTITLREAGYWKHRNSNMEAWAGFAEYLSAQGERVVFVRDTVNAGKDVEGFECCPGASLDIDVRLALYEQAKANLFVSNGPWSCALFGSRPWLMFNAVSATDPFEPNTPRWWQQYHGIGPGEQFPWSAPDQRIIWEADNFANLCRAWEELEPSLQYQQAAE